MHRVRHRAALRPRQRGDRRALGAGARPARPGRHHRQRRPPYPRRANRVTPEDIAADLDESLRQLGLDTIDLYLLHRDDPDVPVGPIVEALNEHLRGGKIRAFGGSNWTHERIAEANAYAADHGLVPFVASSPQFSLVEQVDEPWPGCISIGGPDNAAARDWYQNNQMAMFAWSSLAGGFLSGAVHPRQRRRAPRGGRRASAPRVRHGGQFRTIGPCPDARRGTWRDRPPDRAGVRAVATAQPLHDCRRRKPGGDCGQRGGGRLRLSDAEVAWLDLRRDSR